MEEAQLENGVPTSEGWFVMNAKEGRWFVTPGKGMGIPLTGCDEYEAETFFPMLGLALRIVPAGEPSTTYHWETEQEDFLVLHGEGLLIVEGQERPVQQWDFVHCPPGTPHSFTATGDEQCVLLTVGARRERAWRYLPTPLAESVETETDSGAEAYGPYGHWQASGSSPL
jgi:mannose-6-phosphate isomerase-like protein (cupin superfamily)